jgi:DNA-binding transcriptional LysR family regulator
MTILLAAVDTGSFSAASRKLRIPLTTVSRRVSELEAHLKIRLLLRGTRKLVLTDAGLAYVASCRRLLEELEEVERTATGEYHAPQGELVVSVPSVMGRMHALPVALEFLRQYPDIRMRMQFVDRSVDLLSEHVDVAVRIGELPDSSLVATRVGLVRMVLCASPAYLKQQGEPTTPEELSTHACVAYEGLRVGANWEFRRDGVTHNVDVPWRLIVNSVEAAAIAALDGAGIARLLSYQVAEPLKSGALVTLLEAYDSPSMPVSLIYPNQRQVPLKLRAFLDFMAPRLRERLCCIGHDAG